MDKKRCEKCCVTFDVPDAWPRMQRETQQFRCEQIGCARSSATRQIRRKNETPYCKMIILPHQREAWGR